MPSKSNRDTEPSADFFRQPEAGSNNGVEHPTAMDTEEWDVNAVRLEADKHAANLFKRQITLSVFVMTEL
jgi:hypothetical protein